MSSLSAIKSQITSRWALDFLMLGNCYMEERSNLFGNKIKLQPSLARYNRRGIDLDQYYFVQGGKQEHEYKPGSVHHLLEPDINQDIYGLPQYLAALNSAWLNESATLFRRKYYENGSHAGFIL